MRSPADSPSREASAAADDALAEEAMGWFARLRAPNLSAEDRARFELWLSASSAHRRAYEEICAFWEDPVFTRVLRETPLAAAGGHQPARPRRRAAVAGLALAAGVAVVLRLAPPAPPGCLLADHCTATGERRAVELPDGSRAVLNTGSALDLAYDRDLRRVRLRRGEALFEVRPDPDHPFVVEAPHSRTRVKGTRFVVRAGEGGDTVTVLGGLVETGPPGGTAVLLRENQQFRLEGGRTAAVTPVTGAAAWLNGAVFFDDAPLAEVAAEIGRYRRGLTIVAGARAKSFRVSGRFDIRDPDQALESLEQTLPVRLRRLTPWLLVISAAGDRTGPDPDSTLGGP